VHNGVNAIGETSPLALPSEFNPHRPLCIAMLGRISDWKGQDLLVQAVALLSPANRARVKVRIVGGTFRDMREPLDMLGAQITAADLGDVVTLEPFLNDPSEIYRWADLCVVPSRLPEPFGRVAIEAMAYGRPVIAAAHGGLLEIVEDGHSGWLFPPNDADALRRAIGEALDSPSMLQHRAAKALLRFQKHFSTTIMMDRLSKTLRKWIPKLQISNSKQAPYL
jgi:glycosyltransferase involved in cell wall biosynthesis